MTEHLIENLKCPHCSTINDRHVEMTGSEAGPTEGDVGLCWECLTPFMFILTARSLTELELAEVMSDSDFRRAMEAARKVKRLHPE